MECKRAMTLSRFQPFHLGHLETIRRMERDGYKELVVCIGSAYTSQKPHDPFTFRERLEMVDAVLRDEPLDNYFILPIPDIDRYELYVGHVESLTPKFEAVYAGNPLVLYLFGNAGYRTVEESRKVVTGKTGPIHLSGTKIRESMKDGDEEWKVAVPGQVAKLIGEIKGDERVRKLFSFAGSER